MNKTNATDATRQAEAVLMISTDVGEFTASYSKAGLRKLDFPAPRRIPVKRTEAAGQMARWHEITTRAVRRALAGKPVTEQPPMDLSSGTDFQRKVWAALREIPPGKTETYSRVAALLKKPKGARAVGGACGANPVPLLIPCHRVVAAGGGLGGFSGGLHWKERLLQVEASAQKVSNNKRQT